MNDEDFMYPINFNEDNLRKSTLDSFVQLTPCIPVSVMFKYNILVIM